VSPRLPVADVPRYTGGVNSILIKVVGLALSLVLLGIALEWRLTLLEQVQDGVHGRPRSRRA
jgi:hypothetical protein